MGQLIELMSIGVTSHKTNNVQEQKQISNLSILLRTDLFISDMEISNLSLVRDISLGLYVQ